MVADGGFIVPFFYFISDWQEILFGFLFLFPFFLSIFFSFNVRLTPTATSWFGCRDGDTFRKPDMILRRAGNWLLLDTDITYFPLALLATFLTETLNSAYQKNVNYCR